jgi:hypothetical protein
MDSLYGFEDKYYPDFEQKTLVLLVIIIAWEMTN